MLLSEKQKELESNFVFLLFYWEGLVLEVEPELCVCFWLWQEARII